MIYLLKYVSRKRNIKQEQQTFGRGQQPYRPVDILQQVLPSGQAEAPPGQITLDWRNNDKNEIVSNA